MIRFLMERLRERSTWLGLTAFVSASGVTMAPVMAEAIIAAGTGIAGLILTVTSDGVQK